jgi:Lipase (class 3)
MYSIRFLLLSLLFIRAALSYESCVLPQERASFAAKVRLKMLERSDHLLGALARQKNTNYVLLDPLQRRLFTNSIAPLISFSQDYGYFSEVHPVISHVTKNQEDIELFFCLFKELSLIPPQDNFLPFAIAELLAKGLAYRDLQEGQRIKIPILRGSIFRLEAFTVNHVFNLWHGMPAFGLIPDTKGIPSILLFRGTDLAIYTKRGWSSVLSDVDIGGPGLSVFMQSRDEIHEWLERAANQNKKAIVLGCSLGGSLASYTYLYENALLRETGCIAFNAPGFTTNVLEEWNRLSEKIQQNFIQYVNRGDIISKKGYLFGKAYELSIDAAMKPIFAHTVLMSGQKSFTQSEIDVSKENALR